jgi:hypothetical protein
MPLWGAGLDEDSLEFESENGSVTGSDIDFGIHDNILLNSTDGAPETNAGFRLALEEQSEKKPQWLTPDEKQRCFANNEGWFLRHTKNSAGTQYWDEMLVAIGDMAGTSTTTGIGAATITNISFEGLTSGGANNAPVYEVGSGSTLATAFVRVAWNEPIDFELDGSSFPTLTVTHTADSDDSTTSYTATAPSGNTTVYMMEATGTDGWDTIQLNSTDGAPESNAGEKIILEDGSESADGDITFLQMETQRSGTQMNFYFTIAGSDGAGELTVARQQFGSMGSSTVKDYGISTVSASQDVTQQVSDAVTTAQVNMS